MTATDEQVQALSRAVNGLDAGRRVGWSRAFSAERSRDELARDVNMLRSERDILYRYASFIHGYVRAVTDRYGGAELHEPIARYQRQVGAVLDSTVESAGRLAASGPIEEYDERSGNRLAREARKSEAKTRSNQSGRAFKNARDQERKLLMRRFGIPNEAALFDWLEMYQSPESR